MAIAQFDRACTTIGNTLFAGVAGAAFGWGISPWICPLTSIISMFIVPKLLKKSESVPDPKPIGVVEDLTSTFRLKDKRIASLGLQCNARGELFLRLKINGEIVDNPLYYNFLKSDVHNPESAWNFRKCLTFFRNIPKERLQTCFNKAIELGLFFRVYDFFFNEQYQHSVDDHCVFENGNKKYALYLIQFKGKEELGWKVYDKTTGSTSRFRLDFEKDVSKEECLEFLKNYRIRFVDAEETTLKRVDLEKIQLTSRISDIKWGINWRKWALTLIDAGKSKQDPFTWGGHAELLIEGVKQGRYFIWMAHVKANRDGTGEIILVDKTDKKITYSGKSDTWIKASYRVQKMIDSIKLEISQQNQGTPQIFFNLRGGSALFSQAGIRKNFYKDREIKISEEDDNWVEIATTSPHLEREKPTHNCTTYWIEKLKMVDIDLSQNEFVFKYLFTAPKFFTTTTGKHLQTVEKTAARMLTKTSGVFSNIVENTKNQIADLQRLADLIHDASPFLELLAAFTNNDD